MKLFNRSFFISIVFLLSLCNTSQANDKENVYPQFVFDPSSVTPAELVKEECRNLALDKSVKQEVRPAVPSKDILSGTVGYVVYDFQVDNLGNVKNIELASKNSKKSFIVSSTKVLKKLKFSISPQWLNSCSEQKYRIGYAFRIMTECTYHEFPAPIINVCSEGMIQRIN